MGDISKRLHRKLTKLAPPGVKSRPPKGWRPEEPAPDIPKLIAQGVGVQGPMLGFTA